ncbi:nucleoside deaminase [Nonomuraea typhae]|uniref:Nucleoside deaminase n=1 Tax=Nonomuraea typhae TaxID=2603600 RepID=A0ABW7YZK4_9ACTN
MTPDDERLLRRAIELAAAGRASGNPPFGSLLAADDGTILAEEHNTTITDRDISLHPELKLAVWAARELTPEAAAATTMYTSCQPCGMCTGAIERSGLGRVVYALSGAQLDDLKSVTTAAKVTMTGPALHDEAKVPVEGYY